ncbi:MAG: glycosyltransferase family 4 protein [Phycisphaerales bacterium]|nr:glycosyltransferase family 4 protein [Phycisphaerales bacterium]MCB9857236.1 glycosyltransferase family 4 protein [Phycisphaerales bacterium]MCB9863050.1 glycosyltransferase family 4 protein [Phycisphaerales bacterium]
MPNQPASVCFVAPNNYAVLAGRADIRQIGGAEVQRVLIARELVERGHRVSFVTLDHGQPDGVEHDGIAVFKMCGKDDGVPGLRFIHPRWTSLCAAMRRADADVYVQRTSGVETGQTAMWANSNNKRFIYSVANDPECDQRLGGKRTWRERAFYKYGLRRADRVVAQTDQQQTMLRTHFGIDAVVIRSCAPDPGDPFSNDDRSSAFASRRVLWVGRFSRQKRLDRLTAIAAACPDVRFDVIGDHPNPPPEVAATLAELRRHSNVTLHGFIPYAELPPFYERSSVLLCTSDWEGYPNTFMEAWSRAVPVVSTIDPDSVIARHSLGRVCTRDDATIAASLTSMLTDEAAWRNCADNSRRFYLNNHTPTATGNAWHNLLMHA